jgi:peptidoglycan/LPS O-acetylase OafA/YrhL
MIEAILMPEPDVPPSLNSFVRAEKRVQGIDLLRGFCIVAVVLHHINLRIHFHESTLGRLIGSAADKVLFWSGYYGVRVFFVISGFLIATWSIQRWGALENINLRRFYLMRFARIVPCLIGLLALLVVLDRAGVPRFTINTQHTSLARALLAALTFHVNWLEARTGYLPAAWDVLWSLSVEEVFYVFFPMMCIFLRRQALLIAVLSGFVIVGPFARASLTHNDLWADYGYLSCMDGIALGCLAAMFAAKVRLGTRANMGFCLVGIILCAWIDVVRGAATPAGLYKAGLDVTALGIGVALVLIALQQRDRQVAQTREPEGPGTERKVGTFFRHAAGFPSSIMRWYGRNSYEVYLTHMLMVWPMVILFQRRGWTLNLAPLWFLATAVLAGAAGHVLAQFYSEPLNRAVRRKFLASTSEARAQHYAANQ